MEAHKLIWVYVKFKIQTKKQQDCIVVWILKYIHDLNFHSHYYISLDQHISTDRWDYSLKKKDTLWVIRVCIPYPEVRIKNWIEMETRKKDLWNSMLAMEFNVRVNKIFSMLSICLSRLQKKEIYDYLYDFLYNFKWK
jgi:hypothetical protein